MPMVEGALAQNIFIGRSVNCCVKNHILATVRLVRVLNGKDVLVLFAIEKFIISQQKIE